MRAFRGSVAAAVITWSAASPGQSSTSSATAAQALFEDAKSLMKAGRYEEACPKLEESERLDPGGGTLVALALCYEGQGKLGSAWTEWNEALSDARSAHRPERESLATQHIHALEKKMPRVRVVVFPSASVEGLEVRRDGAPVASPLWGTAVPIDPGEHRFEAHAPGRKAWSSTVSVRAEPTTTDVVVPALENEPPAPAPPPPAAPPPAPPPAGAPPANPPSPAPPTAGARGAEPPAPAAAAAPSASTSDHTWAFVLGGAGVAALAVGAGFGVAASSKWSDAHKACPHDLCIDPAAVSEGKDAGRAADISTALFAVGGVAAAASVVLFLVGGGHEPDRPAAVTVTPVVGAVSGIAVRGDL